MFFAMKVAKGYNRKAFLCPDCKERIKSELLINEYSPYEWGLWLYLSIRKYNTYFYKFYDKVHFDKLKINLKVLGYLVTNDFWDGWKYGMENYSSCIQTFEILEDKIYGKKIKQVKLFGLRDFFA